MSVNNVKTFVIDTNVLIHRPDAILSFRDSEVVIPIWVLEELDKLKGELEGRGRSARAAIRFLNEVSRHGNLQQGVKLESGGTLKVVLDYDRSVEDSLSSTKMDNKIILCAKYLQRNSLERRNPDVFFVSKDINARIKAISIGIKAVDYEKHKINIQHLYDGFRELHGEKQVIKELKKSGETPIPDVSVFPNEYLILKENADSKSFILARCDTKDGMLRLVESTIEPVLGIRPLNPEQRIALDLLLNDNINLVTLIGKAGTGKTLLSLAAGLRKTMEEKNYTRVLLSRPIIPMGKDIGYLPGAKSQKMSHWMQPLFDNLEYIIDVAHKQNLKSIDQVMNNKIIEIEALTYIRGRSLPKQYIIIDEAQNLSPHEVKTIVSRAGEGTKVVITGDPHQIDNPYLDAESNGLTCLVEAFRDVDIAGHVTLGHSERSPLAELASELL
ncbi:MULTISPECIES: PhoH family protein [unclassified Oceanispirochaeta]|uniref:PhoH family protein n=1 Tax=unclassified Oceanispirochaeta TaxID=2635722 RepID=UPI000E09976C|nr:MULTISPECIES: PhoH family protein [unclassified Oceanispirochaeta]MBF9014718.1 PhoH family protein [Oceanispirochaeta sp. M2]NPD70974.1 PhoH family protein [Oceanispirochaeta sp. M1]RDG33807.1 PhoH family protein [Oceanispirochaeta sp. M1]